MRRISIILIILIASCSQTNQESTVRLKLDSLIVAKNDSIQILVNQLDSVRQAIETNTSGLEIGFIVKAPSNLDGCICYNSETQADLDEKRSILLTGLDVYGNGVGLIKINNKIETLELKSHSPQKFIYSNDEYTLIVNNKETRQAGYDSFTKESDMFLISETESIKYSLVGFCGC